jgi:hypothetical protein
MSLISKLFNQNTLTNNNVTLTLQELRQPAIDFTRFVPGIDNVHINVYLSKNFIQHAENAIHALLADYYGYKKHKIAAATRQHLENFQNSYASMLNAVLHRAKEGNHLDIVQLFQISVLKYLTTTTKEKTEELIQKIRMNELSDTHYKNQPIDLYKLINWANKHQNYLIYQVSSELFSQLRWVETNQMGKLRADLFGVEWSIPEWMLLNPLLYCPNVADADMLLDQYILLAPDDFTRLYPILEQLLAEVVKHCHVEFIEKYEYPTETGATPFLSWQDVPSNIDSLFNSKITLEQLQEMPESPEQTELLKMRLTCQQKSLNSLEKALRDAQLFVPMLAAYETEPLYQYYEKSLNALDFFKILRNSPEADYLLLKLENSLKIKPLRSSEDKPLTVSEISNARKRLQRAARKIELDVLLNFVKDVITYRRDIKYLQLTTALFAQFTILQNPEEVQLSRSNNMLYEFLEETEYSSDVVQQIRCHVILKADVRGSTTITSELRKRGLNPATHFSLYFFNPIRKLINQFGAEKVFIEGDAVILSWFEFHDTPAQWLATARAAGLARQMVEVVKAQNQTCIDHELPVLELGIGICYAPEPPAFLYDGEQRIMISPAIGDADRLSSCSWKLRHKYAKKINLLTHVMVFQQAADDAFKGEKGMTTFRYNLNGVELDVAAFHKLQTEIALRAYQVRLPEDEFATQFFVGQYTDNQGESHQLVVRQGLVRLWQETDAYYPVTSEVYYEVVVNPKLLTAIRKLIEKTA